MKTAFPFSASLLSSAVLPVPVRPSMILRGLAQSIRVDKSPVSIKHAAKNSLSSSAAYAPIEACFLKRNLSLDMGCFFIEFRLLRWSIDA